MAIDDPIDAFEQQYVKEEPELPTKLAKFVGDTGFKLAFPEGGLALEILLKSNAALATEARSLPAAPFSTPTGDYTNYPSGTYGGSAPATWNCCGVVVYRRTRFGI